MAEEKKKSGVLTQIIVTTIVSILVGSTSPWWWDDFLEIVVGPQHDPSLSRKNLSNGQFTLTREFLTSRNWQFLHGEGDIISPWVELDPSGRINGIDHPNESRWGLEDGTLVFYHESGAPSTRFTDVRREEGRLVLSGRLLLPGHQPLVIHVLKEQGT